MDLSRDTQRRKINWVAGVDLSTGVVKPTEIAVTKWMKEKLSPKYQAKYKGKNHSPVLGKAHIEDSGKSLFGCLSILWSYL